MSNMNRNPGGTPTGGQFAAGTHAEAEGVVLRTSDDMPEEDVLALQYLEANDYADVEAWARDSDYLLTEDDGWVDHDDNEVDIKAQLAGALEACGFRPAIELDRDEIIAELTETPPKTWRHDDLRMELTTRNDDEDDSETMLEEPKMDEPIEAVIERSHGRRLGTPGDDSREPIGPEAAEKAWNNRARELKEARSGEV